MTSSTQTSDFTAASHHKPKSIIKGIFLVFLWIFIGIYFLIIIVLLAVRLFFLPLVESEKSTIEEKLTELTSYQVTIGNITGSWSLFNPGVMLEDVTIGGADGIHIKSASATLSLLTFARFEPIFLQITVESPSVTAYREGPMRFIFMGQEIDLEKKEDNSNNEALWKTLNWLSHQKQIEVFDGTFKAVNQQNGESFEVTDIKATISNTALTKQAAVELSLPKEIADPITLKARLTPSNPLKLVNLASWNGEFYANTEMINFTEVAKWMPDFNVRYRGVGSGSLWLNTVDWKPAEITFIGAASAVDLKLEPNLQPLKIDYLKGKLQGGIKDNTYSLSTDDLTLQLASGTKVTDFDSSVSLTFNSDNQLLRGSVTGTRVNLGVIEELFPSLPIAPAFKDFVLQRKLSGELYSIAASWEGQPDQPASYEGKMSFKELSSASYVPKDKSDKLWLPGFQNLTGTVEFNPKGGLIKLNSPNSSLSVPKVFSAASFNFQKFIVDANWSLKNNPTFQIKNFTLENKDISATAKGEYIVDGSKFGYLDAKADITRLEATSVWKFIPLLAGKEALTWLHYGILGGTGTGSAEFIGPIEQYPFTNSTKHKFDAKITMKDVALDFYPIQMTKPEQKPKPGAIWPTVKDISGSVTFAGDDMSADITAGKYRDIFLIKGALKLPGLTKQPLLLTVNATAEGALGSYLYYINNSPIKTYTGNVFGKATAKGNGVIKIDLSVPFTAKPKVAVDGSFEVKNVAFNLNQFQVPDLTNLTGKVNFSEKGASGNNISAKAFGQAMTGSFNVSDKTGVTFKVGGTVTAPLLQDVIPVAFLKPMIGNYLAGATPFNMNGSLVGGKLKLDASSTLAGMQIKLPAPFAKPANQQQPFNFAITDEKGTSDVTIGLGNQLNGRMIIRNGDVASAAFGQSQIPPLPNRGYAINFSTPVISVPAWQKVLGFDNSKSKSKGKSAPISFPIVQSVNLKVGNLQMDDFSQKDFSLVGGSTNNGWKFDVSSDQLKGMADWSRASVERSKEAKLTIDLSHLYLPDTLKVTAEQSKPVDVQGGWPAISLNIGDLTYGAMRLGKVELSARNTVTGKGHLWEIFKLHITNPDNVLTSSGSWQKGYDGSNLTTFLVDDKINNLGGLLNRLDMKNLVKAGNGTVKGELSWDGTPLNFNFESFDGHLDIAIKKGEILKIEPGAGAKLLTLLSLQSLTRYLTLDFRDFWSKGFNFDSIMGKTEIDDGVMAIKDLTLVGSGATVVTNGSVNMKKETENLKILVLPDITSAGASIALAIANPVVGLGSFLAQLVFKDPLSKIFSFTYSVTGTWSNPVVKKI